MGHAAHPCLGVCKPLNTSDRINLTFVSRESTHDSYTCPLSILAAPTSIVWDVVYLGANNTETIPVLKAHNTALNSDAGLFVAS